MGTVARHVASPLAVPTVTQKFSPRAVPVSTIGRPGSLPVYTVSPLLQLVYLLGQSLNYTCELGHLVDGLHANWSRLILGEGGVDTRRGHV